MSNNKLKVGDIVRFNVSKSDISHGKRGSLFLCPVAKAVNKKFKDAHVTRKLLNFTYNGRTYFSNIPDGVQAKIRHFDSGRGMEPFSFRAAIRFMYK